LIASSQINRRLLLRRTADSILRRANRATALLGLLLLGIAASGWGGFFALLVPLFGYLASLGFTAPNAMANALAHQGERAGSASALIGTLQFGVATLSSMTVGLFGGGSAAGVRRCRWPESSPVAGCWPTPCTGLWSGMGYNFRAVSKHATLHSWRRCLWPTMAAFPTSRKPASTLSQTKLL